MRMKTSELSGAQLDWAVAQIEGYAEGPSGSFWTTEDEPEDFKPSTDWAQGGPIIERERISLVPTYNGYEATIDLDEGDVMIEVKTGQTPLIAAMRCYVFSKLGDEVEVPDQLMELEPCV